MLAGSDESAIRALNFEEAYETACTPPLVLRGGSSVCSLAVSNREKTWPEKKGWKDCNSLGDNSAFQGAVSCQRRSALLKSGGISFAAMERPLFRGEFCPELFDHVIITRAPQSRVETYLRILAEESVEAAVCVLDQIIDGSMGKPRQDFRCAGDAKATEILAKLRTLRMYLTGWVLLKDDAKYRDGSSLSLNATDRTQPAPNDPGGLVSFPIRLYDAKKCKMLPRSTSTTSWSGPSPPTARHSGSPWVKLTPKTCVRPRPTSTSFTSPCPSRSSSPPTRQPPQMPSALWAGDPRTRRSRTITAITLLSRPKSPPKNPQQSASTSPSMTTCEPNFNPVSPVGEEPKSRMKHLQCYDSTQARLRHQHVHQIPLGGLEAPQAVRRRRPHGPHGRLRLAPRGVVAGRTGPRSHA